MRSSVTQYRIQFHNASHQPAGTPTGNRPAGITPQQAGINAQGREASCDKLPLVGRLAQECIP